MTTMDPERYQRIRTVFHGAWSRPPGERTAYLDGACTGDPELRAHVERLLNAGAQDRTFLSEAATRALGIGGFTGAHELPTSLGRYRIIRLLGEGGMGAAYEAEQENPVRRVAVKTIRPGLGSPEMLRRFSHEAQVLGRLRHPGIAHVHEAGVADGPLGPVPFIAMELVNGIPLDAWITQYGPSVAQRLELLARVGDAVQHAHSNGVVHRDLKPGNILVEVPSGGANREAQPKVLDFGVARLIDTDRADAPLASLATRPGTLIGTLAYMSPEQVSGAAVDARADVYALGVLLFEVLCGRLPRDTQGKTIAEAARIIRDEEPLRAGSLNPSLRGDLDTICQKALERDPERRYQTAAELAMDLRRHLADEPIIARPATVMYQARKFARRHRGLVTGLAGAAVVLVLGVASTVWYAVTAGRERARAQEQEAEARSASYRLIISAAEDGVRREPNRALAQLAQAPEELRNWEWRHLMARLQRRDATVAGDAGVRSSGEFTRDGRARAAVLRSGRVEVIEPASGNVLAAFPALPAIHGLSLSRDGRTLVANGGAPGAVAVYDVESGATRWERAFETAVDAAGVSPDGSLVGLVLHGAGVFVYDVSTGAQRLDAQFASRGVGYGVLEFSADNRFLLCTATSAENPWIAWYDLAGAGSLASREEGYGGAHDPRGGRTATSAPGEIRIRDVGSQELVRTIHGQFRTATSLAFSHDGARLAAYVGKNTLNIWNSSTGELERALGVPQPIHGISMSPAGDALLTSGPGAVSLVSLAEPGIRELKGHTSFVYSVAWSPDGSTVASSGWDGSVRVWNAKTGTLVTSVQAQPVSPPAPLAATAFSRAGDSILVITHAGVFLEIPLSGNHDAVTREDPSPTFWREARGGSKTVVHTGGERESSSVDGTLRSRVDGGEVVVLDVGAGTERRRIQADTWSVTATAFSPDRVHLATAGTEQGIRIWDLRTGKLEAERREHESSVFTLNFSPDGARLVSGDGEGLIFVWETEHYQKVAVLRGHTNYVHSLAFSPDGNTLCSGSGDGTVRLWDAPQVFSGTSH